jgi:hypothetical protein
MSPETKADLLRAVTDFYDVIRGSLDDAELDERSREALLGLFAGAERRER